PHNAEYFAATSPVHPRVHATISSDSSPPLSISSLTRIPSERPLARLDRVQHRHLGGLHAAAAALEAVAEQVERRLSVHLEDLGSGHRPGGAASHAIDAQAAP